MTTQLILAALAGIAVIVALIVWLKVHPFLSLMAGSGVMAISAGVPYPELFKSFSVGLGSTLAGVGLLIILGSMIGTLLISSGGADVIVDTILSKTPMKRLPWAMALIAFVVGIPLFFEVGVVILIPVVMFAARKAKVPVILLGIPALAGLSALHGLVPPHPGPLIAIDALGANLGLTLGLGLLVAIPVVIISGPLLAKIMVKWVPIPAREGFLGGEGPAEGDKRPSFAAALSVVLLPVVLMLARTVVEMTGTEGSGFGAALVFLYKWYRTHTEPRWGGSRKAEDDKPTHSGHGSCWLRQVERGRRTSKTTRMGTRRRRRLPPCRQHRQDELWNPAHRRGSLAMAGSDRRLDERTSQNRELHDCHMLRPTSGLSRPATGCTRAYDLHPFGGFGRTTLTTVECSRRALHAPHASAITTGNTGTTGH